MYKLPYSHLQDIKCSLGTGSWASVSGTDVLPPPSFWESKQASILLFVFVYIFTHTHAHVVAALATYVQDAAHRHRTQAIKETKQLSRPDIMPALRLEHFFCKPSQYGAPIQSDNSVARSIGIISVQATSVHSLTNASLCRTDLANEYWVVRRCSKGHQVQCMHGQEPGRQQSTQLIPGQLGFTGSGRGGPSPTTLFRF